MIPQMCVCVYYESIKREGSREVFCLFILFVYYDSIKREPKKRGIYECRCDERLQTKRKEFTRLAYTLFFMNR
jgi:hypothetical protein